jgi:16S rRNA (guanine527-N7)-methyltransferase
MHKIMIQDYLKKYNFSLSDEEITKFEKLLVIFQEKNAKINLSSIRNEESIIEKHFIDSLFLTNFIELK